MPFKKGHKFYPSKAQFKKGHIPWNKGLKVDRKKYPGMGSFSKRSLEVKNKMKITNLNKGGWNKGLSGLKDDKNPAWRGDKVGYSPLHRWVKKQFEYLECEHCGEKELKAKDGRTLIELANISGQYKRDLSDWLILCRPCHRGYDKKRRIYS